MSHRQKASGERQADLALLGLDQVLERIPVSKFTWYKMIRAGEAPRGVKISRQRVGWWKHQIDDLLQKIMERAA
jgi:predicted DNA-binding transcriptional regulator AlpA